VRDRHEGRHTHYTAQLSAFGPADRLDKPDGRLLAKTGSTTSKICSKGWTNETKRRPKHAPSFVELEISSSAGKKIWRALTQPHLIEEWLMKNDFKPVVGPQFQS